MKNLAIFLITVLIVLLTWFFFKPRKVDEPTYTPAPTETPLPVNTDEGKG